MPLLTRIYPNGSADVNQFQSVGGPGFVLRELMNAGLMHDDVMTVGLGGLRAYEQVPTISQAKLTWTNLPALSADRTIIRNITEPFADSGGLKLLTGRLGRAVIKTSAVPDDRYVIEAPALIFDSQQALLDAFNAGQLEQDFVAVVRFQGPRANGMPELHKLTPPLAVLQGKGYRVALVTDGRMSGASGKVPAAIHVSPEASAGGPLARLQAGDLIRLDATSGTLDVMIDDAVWAAREVVTIDQTAAHDHAHGFGRELFGGMRRVVRSAEEGAITWL